MIKEIRLSEAGQPLTAAVEFIPSAALPPAKLISPRLLALVARLDEITGTDCLPVLRLLAPFGDVTGLGLPANGRAKPLVCELAEHFARRTVLPEMTASLDELGQALKSLPILRLFPELAELPGADDNILWSTHAKLIGAGAYPFLAADLQIGLVTALNRTGWVQSKAAAKSLDARLTGVLRIFPLLPTEALATALRTREAVACGDLIWRTANSLSRIKTETLSGVPGQELSLRPETRRSYFIDSCRLLNHPEWAATIELETPLGENANNSATHQSWKKFMAEDDDLPESDLAPDRFRVRHLEKVERQVSRRLHPGTTLEEAAACPVEHPGLTIYGEELAVMREYHHPLAWNAAHPSEVAALLALFYKPRQRLDALNDERLGIRTAILSLYLTGRSLEWLLRVEVGRWPEVESSDYKLPAPRYVPERDSILYWPEAIPDLPTHTEHSADLFEPVSPVWVLPLPEPLVPWWRELARRRSEGSRILAVTAQQVNQALQDATVILRKRAPNLPALTEGRLRAGYTALIEQDGQLDPLLAAFISGQWRTSLRVPLFYTTVRLELLTKRYRAAVRKMWEVLRQVEPELPDVPSLPLPDWPELSFGSPYFPKQNVLCRAVQTIQAAIDGATNAEDRHNALTLKALYGLALLGGLRISEAGHLRAVDFDWEVIWQGQSLLWLILSETKGNRWTSAGRILPLTEILAPLLKQLLPKEAHAPAFYFLSKGRRLPATREEIRRQIDRLGAPFPRWHAGRHNLRTFLLERGLPFDAINAVLGHQSAGRELFNLYCPGAAGEAWCAFWPLAAELARSLGWKE
jgi:hypothetical protein